MRISQELKNMYAAAVSGDKVYLYFAGHGDVIDDSINKVNQKLLNSTKLRDSYSDATIQKYIYNK